MEIAKAKHLAVEGKWEEVMALAGQKKARGARKVDRPSGKNYYDVIRERLPSRDIPQTIFGREALTLTLPPTEGRFFLSVVKAVVKAKVQKINLFKKFVK